MENEENVNELEDKDSAAADNEMTETDEPKIETGLDQELEAEKLLQEQPQVEIQQYTSDLYETETFSLEVIHQITAGDMLVSVLLAILIGVTLLSRLISRS